MSLKSINIFIFILISCTAISKILCAKNLKRIDDSKLVFGNDVIEQAESGFIKNIYCTPEKVEKYSKIDNLEIKIIKSSKKDETISNFIKCSKAVLAQLYTLSSDSIIKCTVWPIFVLAICIAIISFKIFLILI